MERQSNNSLRRKLNLKLAATIIPVVLLMVFLCCMIMIKSEMSLSHRNLLLKARLCTDRIDSWALRIAEDLRLFDRLLAAGDGTEEYTREILSATSKRNDYIPEGFYIMNLPEDNVSAANFSDVSVYFRDNDTSSEKVKSVTVCKKITDDSENRVLSADISVEFIRKTLKDLVKTPDLDGAILFTPANAALVSETSDPYMDPELIREFSSLDFFDHGFTVIKAGKSKYYGFISPLIKTGMTVVLYVKSTRVLSVIYRDILAIFIIASILVVILYKLLYIHAKKVILIQEKSGLRKKINDALSRSFVVLAYGNLKDNTYNFVYSRKIILRICSQEGKMDTVIEKALGLTAGFYTERMREFLDISTLQTRLTGKKRIDTEFAGIKGGLYNASFIPVEYDENGKLSGILFEIQKINTEILSLREKLTLGDTLIECVRTLTSNSNLEQSIDYFLSIVGDYYQADRTSIIEFDYARSRIGNTYEWLKDGASPQVLSFQDMELEDFDTWAFEVQERGNIIKKLKDLPQDSREYEILAGHGVESFIAVPFLEKGLVTGLIVVQNPRGNIYNSDLLKSVSSFAQEAMLKKRYTDGLYEMSFKDKMTGAMNRHAYLETIKRFNEEREENLGIVFADINGLKKANDEFGHEQGDILIDDTMNLLTMCFSRFDDTIYRIGGDEFVIFCRSISQEKFYEKIESLLEVLVENPVVSIGEVWIDVCDNLEEQVKAADSIMYERKTEYYRRTGKERRH